MTLEPNARRRLHLVCATTRDPELMMELRQVLEEESMSFVPMGGNKTSLNPWLVENYPGSYISMGLTAERLAKKYGVTREQADEFSLGSHRKAFAANETGRFAEEIVPVPVVSTAVDAKGKVHSQESAFAVDEWPRADTSAEALAGAWCKAR